MCTPRLTPKWKLFRFGLNTFRSHGFRTAKRLLKLRFDECRSAYATLLALATQAEESEEEKKRRKADDPCLPDLCVGVALADGCSSIATDGCAIAACSS